MRFSCANVCCVQRIKAVDNTRILRSKCEHVGLNTNVRPYTGEFFTMVYN